jgi:hypothetical protein
MLLPSWLFHDGCPAGAGRDGVWMRLLDVDW